MNNNQLSDKLDKIVNENIIKINKNNMNLNNLLENFDDNDDKNSDNHI